MTWKVERDDENETECEAAHPARLGRNARPYNHDEGSERTRAIEAGRKGYLCPGAEIHFYTTWVVVDPVTRDQDSTHDHYQHAKARCAELNAQGAK